MENGFNHGLKSDSNKEEMELQKEFDGNNKIIFFSIKLMYWHTQM